MEFFAEVLNQHTDTEALSDRLTIANLPVYCASIDQVLSQENDAAGEIYCVWGQFKVSRERIRKGVRFALLNCPHALAWTITCHNYGQDVIVHCTIDKREEEKEFVESIQQFVADWAAGLKRELPTFV